MADCEHGTGVFCCVHCNDKWMHENGAELASLRTQLAEANTLAERAKNAESKLALFREDVSNARATLLRVVSTMAPDDADVECLATLAARRIAELERESTRVGGGA